MSVKANLAVQNGKARKSVLFRSVVFLLCSISQAHALHDQTQMPQISDQGDVAQCVSLVRECFSYHGYNRSNCFFTAATHPFCEGSDLGSLAYRRWVLSPSTAGSEGPSQGDEASTRASFGTQIIDRKCIDSVDEFFQSSIRISTIPADTIQAISTKLEGCRRDLGIELQRQ
jgi:hypothetical protein